MTAPSLDLSLGLAPLTLLGLPLGQLAAVMGAAGAALVVLYVIKQRRRRIEVPFARLWQNVLRQSEATSLWQRLLRWLSLLLQLFILALLIASLGDPRLGRSPEGRSLVLLVDASASMQAVADGPGPALAPGQRRTRLLLAQEQARALVRSLSGDDLAVVVALDAQPAPLGGFSYDERELLGQIDAVAARDTGADLPAALTLARALLAGRANPRVILFSDGGFDDLTLAAVQADVTGTAPLDLRFQPLPPAAQAHPGNVAITAFSVRRYRRNRLSYEVLVGLAAYPAQSTTPAATAGSPPPRRATLELLQEGEIVDVQPIELIPGEQAQRLYPNLSGAGKHLEARLRDISGGDTLPLDDRAFAVLPERRRQRLLLVTRGNLFLEGALLAASAGEENQLVLDKVTPARYDAAQAARYDAVIFDAFTPPAPPDANAVYLDPQGETSPFPVASTLKLPILSDVDAQHPVLRWVSLGDVNMSRASVFRLGPGDRALASMLKQPIIVAREAPGPSGTLRRSLAIGFDLRQTDLPLRVAFPVLLMNAVDWFAGDVDADLGSYRTGLTWRVPLTGARAAKAKTSAGSGRASAELLAETRATVTLPDGGAALVPVHEGHALYFGQRVGFYTLTGTALPAPLLWAANLSDRTESAVTVRSELRAGAGGPVLRPPDAGQRTLRRTLWPYLLLLSLGLLAVEWWTYHRRWTV